MTEAVRDKVRDDSDVRLVEPAASVLGPVPLTTNNGSSVVRSAETLDAFRALRASVGAMTPRGAPAVVEVTGPSGKEGASTVAASLAIALALAGRQVTLVDCNLRAPQLHRLLGCDRKPGLVDVLRGSVTLKELSSPVGAPGSLRFVPAGSTPDVDLLAGSAFTSLVADMVRQADIVVIDAPPVLSSAEAMTIAELATVTLLVAKKSTTRRRQLRAAIQRILQVNSECTAVVLTESDPARVTVTGADPAHRARVPGRVEESSIAP